jgi:Tfp pilus assembly protein PilF
VIAETKYRAAQGCYQAKDYHEAVQNLREAVRLDPNKIAYHKLLGQALTKNPNWRKQAETHLRRVLDAEPYDKDCYLELATIYEDGGLTTRARQMYEQVASLDPDHELALRKLGFEGEAGKSAFFRKFIGKTDTATH